MSRSMPGIERASSLRVSVRLPLLTRISSALRGASSTRGVPFELVGAVLVERKRLAGPDDDDGEGLFDERGTLDAGPGGKCGAVVHSRRHKSFTEVRRTLALACLLRRCVADARRLRRLVGLPGRDDSHLTQLRLCRAECVSPVLLVQVMERVGQDCQV